MLISKKIHFHMGHRVPYHNSLCRNLHGHTYNVVVGVDDELITTEGVSDQGMVMDYKELKEVMMQEIDSPLDHGFMIYEKDCLYEKYFKAMKEEGMKIIVVPFIPTAENISKYLFEKIKTKLDERRIRIEFVEVYETPTSTAKYTKKNYETAREIENE